MLRENGRLGSVVVVVLIDVSVSSPNILLNMFQDNKCLLNIIYRRTIALYSLTKTHKQNIGILNTRTKYLELRMAFDYKIYRKRTDNDYWSMIM